MTEINLKIEPKLQQIVNEILAFNEEIGDARGTPKRFSVIISYLLIYQKLTQTHLQKLTKYSLSSISFILNSLLNARIVRKSLITGTHGFDYQLTSNIINTNLMMVKQILIFINNAQKFLLSISLQLNNSNLTHLMGYNILIDQIEFMIDDFKAYSQLISNLLLNFEGKSKKRSNENFIYQFSKSFDLFSPIKLDTKLLIYEEKIIKFLKDTIFVNSKSPSKTLILPYFFTRGMLTQIQIKNITNLSIGAISQGLKELKNQNLIDLSPLKRNQKGKKLSTIYRVKSISMAVANRFYHICKIIVEWNPRFLIFENILKNNYDSLKYNKIFSHINLYIKEILKITPMYKEFIEHISKIK